MPLGEVVKLDRGFPLVRLLDDDAANGAANSLPEGDLVRCKHATALVKGERMRAVIGDRVVVDYPEGHDKAIIAAIEPRTRVLVRKDPTERAVAQVLAANFDRVVVAQPLSEVNEKRLERELVLACETGAAVTVVLTKADLAESESQVESVRNRVRLLAGSDIEVLVVSASDPASVERVRALVPAGSVAVLMGKSGVGKSSLVNLLVGSEVQQIGAVREGDGKGRHTTVSREMIQLPGGGRVVDMPGVRGLGLWDADAGIGAAFADIEEAAARCRFRDCKHEQEPGCAVRAAVEAGEITRERWESYRSLKQEMSAMRERREQARWMQGEKSSGFRGRRSGSGGGGAARRGRR